MVVTAKIIPGPICFAKDLHLETQEEEDGAPFFAVLVGASFFPATGNAGEVEADSRCGNVDEES